MRWRGMANAVILYEKVVAWIRIRELMSRVLRSLPVWSVTAPAWPVTISAVAAAT
jgi:hypothetical protein